jgi:hypothetical protein
MPPNVASGRYFDLKPIEKNLLQLNIGTGALVLFGRLLI